MKFLLFASPLFLVINYVISSNPSSYCLPIQPISQDSPFQSINPKMGQQGRPGKIGPSGPKGPIGPPGLPGRCACEPSEIEELRTEMRNLYDQLKMDIETGLYFILELIVTFSFY